MSFSGCLLYFNVGLPTCSIVSSGIVGGGSVVLCLNGAGAGLSGTSGIGFGARRSGWLGGRVGSCGVSFSDLDTSGISLVVGLGGMHGFSSSTVGAGGMSRPGGLCGIFGGISGGLADWGEPLALIWARV